jgi:hypothetical protein
MSLKDYFNSLKLPEQRLAWLIAMAADAVQIAGFPFFAEGGISVADSVLDVVVGVVLIRLLGWHWAFLPTLAAELVPGLDLFPTWTAAVWFVTRERIKAGDQEVLPPGPAPERRN